MGSRARIAAAACLVASGLLAGAAGAPTALADTGSAAGAEDAPDRHTEKAPRSDRASDGDEPDDPADPADPADKKPADDPTEKPGDDPTEKPSDVPEGEDRAPGEAKTPSGRPVVEGDDGDVEEEEPRPPCCQDGSDDCGPGWPWPWPWPAPDDPSDLPTSDGEYGENRPETVPPTGPMPPMGEPESPRVLDIVPGIGVGPNDATQAPISVPIIITRPIGIAASPGPTVGPAVGAGSASGGTGAGSPVAPRQGAASPPPRPPLPAPQGSSVAMPGSAYRVGYAEGLRGAGLPQLAALALPGLAGILVLTGAGGLVGYRQARAGQRVRPRGIARFMN